MNPIIGHAVVIAAILAIVFFSGRSVLRGIKAEMRGEKSCAGCSRCGAGCAECRLCVEKLEMLKDEKSRKNGGKNTDLH